MTGTTFSQGDQKAQAPGNGFWETADGSTIDTHVSHTIPQLSSACPMLDTMYGISIYDHECVTIDPKTYFYMLCNRFTRDFKIPEGFISDGSVFWVGYGFNTYLYERADHSHPEMRSDRCSVASEAQNQKFGGYILTFCRKRIIRAAR
ncbi:MAG: hypothetical protein RRC34_01395 [Lentisphaeria bacterium]|nr:hypothetical protein [Lentisphaeria bacterium]